MYLYFLVFRPFSANFLTDFENLWYCYDQGSKILKVRIYLGYADDTNLFPKNDSSIIEINLIIIELKMQQELY